MKIIKIKYRGDWKVVLGIAVKGEETYYKVQNPLDKTKYYLLGTNSKEITAIEEKDFERQPSVRRKTRTLTKEEIKDVREMYMSGHYYLKEICEKYNITNRALKKVVENEIRSKTNKM